MYVCARVLVTNAAACIPVLQAHHPLPLSPQNYPLHGSEVNGFHSVPTTYSHTATHNGDGSMGEPFHAGPSLVRSLGGGVVLHQASEHYFLMICCCCC